LLPLKHRAGKLSEILSNLGHCSSLITKIKVPVKLAAENASLTVFGPQGARLAAACNAAEGW